MTAQNSVDIGKLLARINPEQIKATLNQDSLKGTPFFTDNSLAETTKPLAQIIRYLFIQRHVTEESFSALHNRLADKVRIPVNHRNTDRNNTKRALREPNVTWELFEKTLQILGLNRVNMILQLQDEITGEVFTVSTEDIAKVLREHPYPADVFVSRAENEIK